ncbi:MAG: peptide deformylase [Actinomycetota bacterium]|nr:peptide deformylase [Actinomycetota bacterium]
MILPIRTIGDPVLKTRAKPVTEFGAGLRTLADDMIETMYAAPGVGLAGPQVGVSQRLFVFDDGQTGPLFLANPELFDADGEQVAEEGCLSIPGPYYPTSRGAKVSCRGQDLDGGPFEITGEGLLARILQHETDHLEGMLFIDRLDDVGRREVLAELRRIELGIVEPRDPRRIADA